MSVLEYLGAKATQLFETTAFAGLEAGNVIMMVVGIFFIYLAIAKHYEPLLLVPIGFGILVGNIPSVAGMALSVYDEGTVLQISLFRRREGRLSAVDFSRHRRDDRLFHGAFQPQAACCWERPRRWVFS